MSTVHVVTENEAFPHSWMTLAGKRYALYVQDGSSNLRAVERQPWMDGDEIRTPDGFLLGRATRGRL